MHNHDTLANSKSSPSYTCPMHPAVKQDEPGSCPECGMNLVINAGSADNVPQMNCCHKPSQRTSLTSKKPKENRFSGILNRPFGRKH